MEEKESEDAGDCEKIGGEGGEKRVHGVKMREMLMFMSNSESLERKVGLKTVHLEVPLCTTVAEEQPRLPTCCPRPPPRH